MRLTRLGWLNVVLYGAIVLLILRFGSELRWSAGALADYWDHRFPPLRESTLRAEAFEILLAGGDLERAEGLLRESLEIEPYTVAVMLLGEVYLARGEIARAVDQYERYVAINPSHVESHLRLAQIHGAEGRTEERRRVLRRALAHFRSEAELQRPRLDPSAPEPANEKALRSHQGYLTAIERLERAAETEEPLRGS